MKLSDAGGANMKLSDAALAHVAARSSGPPLDRSLRVTLNFHPDRRTRDGRRVIEALADDGEYRSQFETGISNGGLTAYPGGDRSRWEHRVFGGAYDDAPASARPKYGALNRRRLDVGAAPRFGSAHLRLAECVLERTSFCYPDSVFEPTRFGVVQRCDLIALADAAAAQPRTDHDEATTGGVLDDYVEAHVHGRVLLDADVEAVVLDPCHAGTPVADAALDLGVPVEWHAGRRLSVGELARHPDFRGPEIVRLGHRVAVDGWLDAAVISRAVDNDAADPQDLKKLWHCVSRFGNGVVA